MFDDDVAVFSCLEVSAGDIQVGEDEVKVGDEIGCVFIEENASVLNEACVFGCTSTARRSYDGI